MAPCSSEEEIQDVLITVTVVKQALFLPEFFDKLQNLKYPKSHIFLHVVVQNGTKFDYVKLLLEPVKSQYKKVKFLPSDNPGKAKQEAIHYAKNFRVKSILFLSSVAQLEDPNTLMALVKADKDVVAPFMKTYEKFNHVRRICDAGAGLRLNDSHSFPDLVTLRGIKPQNYEKILVRLR